MKNCIKTITDCLKISLKLTNDQWQTIIFLWSLDIHNWLVSDVEFLSLDEPGNFPLFILWLKEPISKIKQKYSQVQPRFRGKVVPH
jgi:hypothetical protein